MTRFWPRASVAALALVGTLEMANADGILVLPAATNPVMQKECAACHMLYVPGLLPARSWTNLINGLANHFGENADLGADVKLQLTSYLTANAGDAAGHNHKMLDSLPTTVTPLRITELPWWKRKHERRDRVSLAALRANKAKFKGDCAACHQGAAKGRFAKPRR